VSVPRDLATTGTENASQVRLIQQRLRQRDHFTAAVDEISLIAAQLFPREHQKKQINSRLILEPVSLRFDQEQGGRCQYLHSADTEMTRVESRMELRPRTIKGASQAGLASETSPSSSYVHDRSERSSARRTEMLSPARRSGPADGCHVITQCTALGC
jgi:hypothetical protein